MALKSNALTTYATVKAELGLTDDTQQIYLERQINVVSDKIERYCSRKFKKQELTEKYIGSDSLYLLLDNWPINSLTSITTNSETVDITDVVIFSEEGKIYDQNGFFKSSIYGGLSDYETLDALPNIEIVYNAGYLLPDDVDRDLPYDLEEACIKEIVRSYEVKGKSKGIDSWSLDKASETSVNESKVIDDKTGLLITTLSTLESYRRRFL